MTRTIGIYVYDDVEVPDFAGPYDVFTCATRVSNKTTPNAPPPKSDSGKTVKPARARSSAEVRPMVRTRNGGGAFGVVLLLTRVAQVNTSYGPAKSGTSTSS